MEDLNYETVFESCICTNQFCSYVVNLDLRRDTTLYRFFIWSYRIPCRNTWNCSSSDIFCPKWDYSSDHCVYRRSTWASHGCSLVSGATSETSDVSHVKTRPIDREQVQ